MNKLKDELERLKRGINGLFPNEYDQRLTQFKRDIAIFKADLVFLMSKHFQSVTDDQFICMTDIQCFCEEAYQYIMNLKQLDEAQNDILPYPKG